MEQQDEVRLCEELELLFAHTEGQITLEEYHRRMEELQKMIPEKRKQHCAVSDGKVLSMAAKCQHLDGGKTFFCLKNGKIRICMTNAACEGTAPKTPMKFRIF